MTTFDMTPYELGSRPELFEQRAIFLSASVPYERSPDDVPPGYTVEDSKRFAKDADPFLINDAIAHFCRFAFRHDIDLIFGGHPAITPMILESARRFGKEERRRVVVFQSLHFKMKYVKPLYQLVDEGLGTPLVTREVNRDRWLSLTYMRELMISSENIIGAVFIGGMEGLLEEADIFKKKHPDSKCCFAVGSTGGASRELLQERDGFSGKIASRDFLAKSRSYPLVMQRVFEEIEHHMRRG